MGQHTPGREISTTSSGWQFFRWWIMMLLSPDFSIVFCAGLEQLVPSVRRKHPSTLAHRTHLLRAPWLEPACNLQVLFQDPERIHPADGHCYRQTHRVTQ